MKAFFDYSRYNWSLEIGITLTAICIFVMSPKLSAREYGYLLEDDTLCSIWWAEGAYKVMKDDPVPIEEKIPIYIRSAANEYEPFMLILRPKKRMDNVRIEIGELKGSSVITEDNISISHVEYIKVTTPTDEYGSAGEWADPLPPYEGPFTIYPGENHPLWVTIHVPSNAKFGTYETSIALTSGSWKKEIPVRLKVWNFVLPKETHLRSSFGLSTSIIKLYHNLETEEELENVFDLYAHNFKEHRISPTNPLSLYPMKVNVSGVNWKGGEFVSKPVYSGKRALKVEDNSIFTNVEAQYEKMIFVDSNIPYKLSWFVKTGEEEQEYCVKIKCYNHEGEFLPTLSLVNAYIGSTDWKQEVMEIKCFPSVAEEVPEIKCFPPEVAKVSLHFYSTFIFPEEGETSIVIDKSRTGTAYFDDVKFSRTPNNKNLLNNGDFDVGIDQILVDVDFTEFDRGAKKYLDGMRFNSFDLRLYGLGFGWAHYRQECIFKGFRQSTPEYGKLLSRYLQQVEKHLDENGWLGREYIYWFDEPNPNDYPFIREGMKNIRKGAPRLTRFIVEEKQGQGIKDVTEIICTIFDKIDPEITVDLIKQGKECWSYICTVPKGPWVTHFIDHPAVNLRMWVWMSYKFQLKGILDWRTNYWNCTNLYPSSEGILQNPWEDPMGHRGIRADIPLGRPGHWGNGEGRFLYPPNRDPNNDKTKYLCGPINSIRWEILREGIEDYEYFWMLQNAVDNALPSQKALADEGRELLNFPESLFKSGKEYTKDPRMLLEYRSRIASVLNRLLSMQ